MWRTEWDALSARIAAFLEAANYLASAGSQGFYGADELAENGKRILEHIRQFHETHGPSIPASAAQALATWNERPRNLGGGTGPQHQVHHLAIILSSLRAEMNHLLTSVDAVGRSLVARAFQHLQRSIIADPALSSVWQQAFDAGEVVCEKLGACHLLLHGIWAFKVAGKGERTDLVLGEPLRITETVRAAAEVLVLTEWKVFKGQMKLGELCQRARKEAGLYASGVLAGFELASRRYVVVVSEQRQTMPEPEPHGDVVYEYVNIAVAPAIPSVDATGFRSHRARPAPPAASSTPAAGSLEEAERLQILKALDAAGGNKTEAARILGIERKTLYRKLKMMGLK
jgi:hypothetical protein